MLMYDLTHTRLLSDDGDATLPTDGGMLGITVALLLVTDRAYGEIGDHGIILTHERIEDVAACIEERLPALARDTGRGEELRKHLANLGGCESRPSLGANLRSRVEPVDLMRPAVARVVKY